MSKPFSVILTLKTKLPLSQSWVGARYCPVSSPSNRDNPKECSLFTLVSEKTRLANKHELDLAKDFRIEGQK